jgi:hypothetical protein
MDFLKSTKVMNKTEIFRKGDSVIYVENKPFDSIFSKSRKVRKSRTAIRITKSMVETDIKMVTSLYPSLSINEVSQRVMGMVEMRFNLKGEYLSYDRTQTVMRMISNYFTK